MDRPVPGSVLLAAYVTFLLPVLRLPVPEGLTPMVRWVGLGGLVAFGLAGARGLRVPPGGHGPFVFGLAFLASALVSSVGGANAQLALAKLVPLACEVVLAVSLLPVVMGLGDWRWWLTRVRWVLTATCAAALVIGLLVPGGVNSDGRLAAVSNPNSTGFLAMCASCLWLAALAAPGAERRASRVAFATLACCAIVLWWTGSRASIGGFAVGVLLWAVVTQRWKLASSSVAAAALLFVIAPQLVRSGAEATEAKFLRGGGLISTRESIWEESLSAWSEQPWLGFGFGVSATAEAWEAGPMGQSLGSLRDGSGYLGLLESVGILGSSLLGALVVSVMYAAVRGSRGPDWVRGLAEAGLLLLGALLANAGAEPWLLGPGSLQSFTFWAITGMILSLQSRPHTQKARTPAPWSAPQRQRTAKR